METQDVIKLIQSDNLMKFYKGKDWMSLRLVALRRDNQECQNCKSRGKYRKADCVHHMKEVKDHPELALSLDNLQSLCNSCHNEIHGRESIWELNKKAPEFINEERW
ncbi:HNH endonuclease [Neobacillus niacini]|uniref:HNH endonuclease n=1 Tax=Neobacillus niacini TaxID=86668 RepID=UPI002FFE195F